MNLTALVKIFEQQAQDNSGVIHFNDALLGTMGIDEDIRSFLHVDDGIHIQVDQKTDWLNINEEGSQLDVYGITLVGGQAPLRIENHPVVLQFLDTVYQFTLILPLEIDDPKIISHGNDDENATYRLSQHFSGLKFLSIDDLELTKPKFIYSSYPIKEYPNPIGKDGSVELKTGLNFFSELRLVNLFGALFEMLNIDKTDLDGAYFSLEGHITPSIAFGQNNIFVPNTDLRARIGSLGGEGVKLGTVTFGKPFIGVKIEYLENTGDIYHRMKDRLPALLERMGDGYCLKDLGFDDDAKNTFGRTETMLYLGQDIDLGNDIQVQARVIIPRSFNSIQILVASSDWKPVSIDNLANLIAGNADSWESFTANLPTSVQDLLKKFILKSLRLNIGRKNPLNPSHLSLSVGTLPNRPWAIDGKEKHHFFAEFDLTWSIFNLLDSNKNRRTMTASIEGELHYNETALKTDDFIKQRDESDYIFDVSIQISKERQSFFGRCQMGIDFAFTEALEKFANDALNIKELTLPPRLLDVQLKELGISATATSESKLFTFQARAVFSEQTDVQLNVTFDIGAANTTKSVSLEVGDIKFSVMQNARESNDVNAKKQLDTLFTAHLDKLNIGQFVENIVQRAKPDFILPFPADLLTQVSFDDLTLEINLTQKNGRLLSRGKTVFGRDEQKEQILKLNDPLLEIDGSFNEKAIPLTRTQRLLSGDDTNQKPEAFWINIQKNIGPLYFQRVGIEIKKQLTLLFDASFSLGGIEIGIEGLGVAIPLGHSLPDDFHAASMVRLRGLSISYNRDPVEIAGGFLRSEDDDGHLQYTGNVTIKAGSFNLSAIGAYSQLENKSASLFIFAVLNTPLGGPPAFFIEGLALGFGYNRNLRIPTIDQVKSFPFVQAAIGHSSDDAIKRTDSPKSALSKLSEFVKPEEGAYWFAGGIKFSSFEMVKAFVLIIVALAKRFEIDLLGLAQITVPSRLPAGQTPLAYAEIVVRAQMIPTDGFCSIQAKLVPENSYILDKTCRLSGGLAFFAWFSNAPQHAGDFVLSIGGYHPRFNKPEHYPTVPRLGINWNLSDKLPSGSEFHIKGEAYFAMTPQMLMAGGTLEAVWKNKAMSASFNAYADFILGWAPLYYSVDVGISAAIACRIEALVNVDIDAKISAVLHLEGPDFSGTAIFDLSILSVEVKFGKGATKPLMSWAEFRKSFLSRQQSEAVNVQSVRQFESSTADPETGNVCGITIVRGLVQDISGTVIGDEQEIDWIIQADNCLITTSSRIPIENAFFNTINFIQNENSQHWDLFGIAPLGNLNGEVSSIHTVTLSKFTLTPDGTEKWEVVNQRNALEITPIIGASPKALWWYPDDKATSEEQSIEKLSGHGLMRKTLLGLSIQGKVLVGDMTKYISIEELTHDDHIPVQWWDWSQPVIPNNSDIPANQSVFDSITQEATNHVRARIIEQLSEQVAYADGHGNIDLEGFTSSSLNLLPEPKMSHLGSI